MTLKLLVKKLEWGKLKFITREEIKGYCRDLGMDYYPVIRYLTHNRYLLRILKGIFYVKSIEERKLKRLDINHLEAIKEALKIKGVEHWYFGLETALKLNNFTHEYFTIDYIINDKIFRAKPIRIMDHKVRFVKISSRLLNFGIVKHPLPHSDLEKTFLDFVYLKKKERGNFELLKKCSKKKLHRYSTRYPKNMKW